MDQKAITTTRLLLARHGQTALSLSDAFCGTTEAPLTATGREQAERLAQRLSREHIDALYCSPQGRTRETAKPVAALLNLEIQIREALREMNFGLWEQRVQADVAREWPQEMAAWKRGSWVTQLPGGETQQAVIARIVPCIVELLAAHPGQTVLIVSHRTALRLLVGHLMNLSLPGSRGLHLDPASVSCLLVKGDQAELVFYNDTSHLA
jgi:broad specificity phosphatase PhoE